ncbi:MAG: MBL fold metallo-hydrolase [Planctomycetota bacterium]
MRIVHGVFVGLILLGIAVAESEKPPLPKPTEIYEKPDLRIERHESACNTYLLFCTATDEFVCIDPSPKITAVITAKIAENKKFKAIWITHEHGDHVAGLAEVLAKYEVPAVSCAEGKKGIVETAEHWKDWGFEGTSPPPAPDTIIEHGDEVKVGKLTFTATHLPGHSHGSLGYYLKDRILFAGDVLFRGSIGRTDLPTSDRSVFEKSLSDHLWDLPDAVDVFPGHGDRTTMKREKKMNWLFQDFVRAGRGEEPIERPWFGIGIDRERKEKGLKLTQISPGSPAEKCGLKPGDVIVKMGEKVLAGVDDFMKVFVASKVGDKVPLVVMRGEEKLEVTIEFTARPKR